MKIYTELPSRDPRYHSEYVRMLNKSVYGTRDAPQSGALSSTEHALEDFWFDNSKVFFLLPDREDLHCGSRRRFSWCLFWYRTMYELDLELIVAE